MLAAASTGAQRLPPVRPLGPITEVSPADLLGSVSMVRPLPNGGVIVNDITRRQLLLLDAQFKRLKTIADTTAATDNTYGATICGLFVFRGDSSLFLDSRSLTMLVIDAKGEVARVMAVPNPDDASLMIGGPFGTPSLDAQGRIVYRGHAESGGNDFRARRTEAPVTAASFIDSAAIHRIAIATRERATLTYLTISKPVISNLQDATGRITGTSFLTTPLPVVDDWALMPDGRVAVVRGADYHVDWLGLDGRWTTTAKIPHNWQRLDDDAKERVIDSSRVEAEKERESFKKRVDNLAGNTNALMSAVAGPSFSTGVTLTFSRADATSGRPRVEVTVPIVRIAAAKDLPDYRPAFRMGAARADVEGNLWVRTTAPSDAGPIYDVINGKGELTDRVKLPYGRVISGFGPGVVYMGVQDDKGARLEMARIK